MPHTVTPADGVVGGVKQIGYKPSGTDGVELSLLDTGVQVGAKTINRILSRFALSIEYYWFIYARSRMKESTAYIKSGSFELNAEIN